MTEESKTFEPERYQYAKVAMQFFQQKNLGAAKKSLEKLAGDMQVPEDARSSLVWNASKDIEGWMNAAKINDKKYDEILGKKTVKNLYDRYNDFFEKYLDEDERNVARAAFDAFGDELYSDVMKKMEMADYILNPDAPEGLFDEKKKEEAKKTREKYSLIYDTIKDFESIKMQRLVLPVIEDSIKDNVKERFKKEEKKKAA